MTWGRLLTGVVLACVTLLSLASYRQQIAANARLGAQLAQLEERLDRSSGQAIRIDRVTTSATDPQVGAALERLEKRLESLPAHGPTDDRRGADERAPGEPPTDAQRQAAASGRAVIERSVRAGSWTDESRLELGRWMASTDQAARDELARSLVQAVNSGKLMVDGSLL